MITETIYYSGQGYIYRCPHCQKVDRQGNIDGENTCRFCEKPLSFVEQLVMTPELHSVIRQINFLETGIERE